MIEAYIKLFVQIQFQEYVSKIILARLKTCSAYRHFIFKVKRRRNLYFAASFCLYESNTNEPLNGQDEKLI